ncbi:hypothetical protein [Streptomyces longisporoflavus]|uniref:Methyltransferase n=1 Tax=Streptomyces longisporoflavus TaxID=28044 RepID=A0ABW7QH34_9ACTN
MTEATYLHTTRTAYDTVAEDYEALTRAELGTKPLDRAMLTAFTELVRPDTGPVADLGCGPGRITAFLHARGIDALGIDLSPTSSRVLAAYVRASPSVARGR